MPISKADANLLADALKRNGYNDWWVALVSAAVDAFGGDIPRSIRMADDVYRRNPDPKVAPNDGDAEAVLGKEAVAVLATVGDK